MFAFSSVLEADAVGWVDSQSFKTFVIFDLEPGVE